MSSIARNEAGGILLLDKPEGLTSQDAVNIVRKVFGTKQAGHTGTLDPMATGLLTVLVGRAVKASEYAVCDRKSYRAVLRLGKSYDTQDITGTVLSESDIIPGEETVLRVCTSFTGEIEQLPPMYSAIKVNGKKLYELAREGREIEREKRKIRIYSLSAQKLNDTDYSLDVECSSGTYIRTLCADIGSALGCGAAMAALRRTSVGHFSLTDAHDVFELKKLTAENPDFDFASLLLPVEELFAELPSINTSAFHEKLLRSGCAVAIHKLGIKEAALGQRFALFDADGIFYALSECVEGPEGPALKSIKLFVL